MDLAELVQLLDLDRVAQTVKYPAKGAASLGMQRQFWSNNVTAVLPWLNEHVPRNGRVWFHEVNVESYRTYQLVGGSDRQGHGGAGRAVVDGVAEQVDYRDAQMLWDYYMRYGSGGNAGRTESGEAAMRNIAC